MTAVKRVSLPSTMIQYEKTLRPFDKDLLKTITDSFTNTAAILDRGISFADNIDCDLVSFTSSGTPDAENTVTHYLGKAPTGFLVYSKDKAGDLYDSGTTNTSTSIYLKCSVATVAFKIIVF